MRPHPFRQQRSAAQLRPIAPPAPPPPPRPGPPRGSPPCHPPPGPTLSISFQHFSTIFLSTAPGWCGPRWWWCGCTETAVYCELRVRADHRGPADHGSARAREPRPPLGAAAWPGLKAPPLGAARRRPCRRIPRGLRPSAPLAQQGGSPAPRRGCAGSSALSPAPRRGCTGSCVAQRRLYRQGRRRSPAQGRRRGGPALVNSRR